MVGKIRELEFGTTENRCIVIRIGDWALTVISLSCVRERCKAAGVQDRAPSLHNHQFLPFSCETGWVASLSAIQRQSLDVLSKNR